jgi:hypothetical protein
LNDQLPEIEYRFRQQNPLKLFNQKSENVYPTKKAPEIIREP